MRYLKREEGGVDIMCEVSERIMERGRKIGEEQGRKIGEEHGRKSARNKAGRSARSKAGREKPTLLL